MISSSTLPPLAPMAPFTTPSIFTGIPPPKITTHELFAVLRQTLADRSASVWEIVSGRVECSCRPCFVDGNVDATKPRVIHPHVGDKTASGIDHGNVVGDAQLDCFFSPAAINRRVSARSRDNIDLDISHTPITLRRVKSSLDVRSIKR